MLNFITPRVGPNEQSRELLKTRRPLPPLLLRDQSTPCPRPRPITSQRENSEHPPQVPKQQKMYSNLEGPLLSEPDTGKRACKHQSKTSHMVPYNLRMLLCSGRHSRARESKRTTMIQKPIFRKEREPNNRPEQKRTSSTHEPPPITYTCTKKTACSDINGGMPPAVFLSPAIPNANLSETFPELFLPKHNYRSPALRARNKLSRPSTPSHTSPRKIKEFRLMGGTYCSYR